MFIVNCTCLIFPRYLARKVVEHLRLETRYQKEMKAVLLLQKFWRRHHTNLKLQRERKKAAVVVQKYWRCYIERKKFTIQRKSATRIQACWKARKAYMEHQRKKSCIITIQKVCRGFLVRKLMQRQHSSATLIQKQWKGYISRQTFIII